MSLHNKTAIITGGSRGIGAGIAIELARLGANILLTYISSAQKASEIVSQITSSGGAAIAVQADCMDPASPQKIVSAATAAFGARIDIVVNNAGAGDELYLADCTLEHFDKVFYTNVRFPMFLVKECLPYLPRGGRVVNVSSVCARQGWPMQTAYSASKACMESFAKTWAAELGHTYGITVNAVNPGPVATDMWNATPVDAVPGMQNYIDITPAAPRVGEVDDVVQVVAFLCEERSRWVTGSTVCANGGACFV
ncbi:short chain oxidoreductase/dehydrogenase [Mytilinidion resinicola]|uniref:Short chain oxidoreductase/dehydrogenase n=1 Tax=Mytilinidion resinicola TaxID=574789 RepID=A0A6A6Y9U4_9PEZI|nr:short chain oxidoreductase/dehydrogenase [Mytilinidion resinicola]KAF2804885.1 short chain oxidoreductase/dehydrogenase [Mytilinidion resinicola]